MDKPFPDKKMPDGIEVRQVTEVSGVADFASVTIRKLSKPGHAPEVGAKIFASPERLLKPYNHMVVAYDKDQPVSAAMLIFSNSIAGIYWVGTVPERSRQGVGRNMCRAVTNEAFRRGAPLVVLQASKFGEPVYRRMGFTEFTRYPWYMYFEKITEPEGIMSQPIKIVFLDAVTVGNVDNLDGNFIAGRLHRLRTDQTGRAH